MADENLSPYWEPHQEAFAQYWVAQLPQLTAPVQGDLICVCAFLLWSVDQGHGALPLSQAQTLWREALGESPLEAGTRRLLTAPMDELLQSLSLQNHLKSLPGSPILISEEGGDTWYSLAKMAQSEEDLARWLQKLMAQPPLWSPGSRNPSPETQAPGWMGLSPDQKECVSKALTSSFFLLTGGPGTGKTTTVFQILLQILFRMNALGRPLRVALAAPTGRAASRLSQSLTESIQKHTPTAPAPWAEILKSLSLLEAFTLHKLIGMRGSFSPPLHDSQNPLPYDLVIVDEASMGDMNMMHHLAKALPTPGALFLVGDKDQLPSVEVGAILSDLTGKGPSPVLSARIGFLTTNHRLQPRETGEANPALILSQFFQSVLSGRLPPAEVFGSAEVLDWVKADSPHLREYLLKDAVQYWSQQWSAPWNPSRIQTLLEERILLTPLRKGPWGSGELGQEILKRLNKIIPFQGLPWIINRNLPSLDLANGDRGIVHLQGQEWVCSFPTGGECKTHPFALLQEDGEPSLAMTIHKSQGSEFQKIWLLLPPGKPSSRQALYTALTRARKSVKIFGKPEDWEASLKTVTRRWSRLGILLDKFIANS